MTNEIEDDINKAVDGMEERSRWNQRSDMSELLNSIMRPDLAGEESLLTKELKISNIKRADLDDKVVEMTDIAFQWKKLGADKFSKFLVILRDTFLSGTSSVDGFERRAEITDVKEFEIREQTKNKMSDKLFNRGEG